MRGGGTGTGPGSGNYGIWTLVGIALTVFAIWCMN
jgi:hypothetical protein